MLNLLVEFLDWVFYPFYDLVFFPLVFGIRLVTLQKLLEHHKDDFASLMDAGEKEAAARLIDILVASHKRRLLSKP